MTEVVKFSVFLLWFLQSYPGETAHICQPNLICVPQAECEINVDEAVILYPCRRGVCCPKLKNTIIGTTRRYEPFNTIKTTNYPPSVYTSNNENRRKETTPSYQYNIETTPHSSHLTKQEYTSHSNLQENIYSNTRKGGSHNQFINNNNNVNDYTGACEPGLFCVSMTKCGYKFNNEEVLYPCDQNGRKICCPRLKNLIHSESTTPKYKPFNTITSELYNENNFFGSSTENTEVQVARTNDTVSIYNHYNNTDIIFNNYSNDNSSAIEDNILKNDRNPTKSNKYANFKNNTIYNIQNNDRISQQQSNKNEKIEHVTEGRSQFNNLDRKNLSEAITEEIFPKNCGLTSSQDKITGGKIADLGQFPWMALLGFKHHSGQSLQFLCGGSLITRRDVLTAAHCILENRHLELYSIRLGEYNLTTERDCVEFGQYKTCADYHLDVGIDRVTIHPKFNRKNFKNDIAIIRMRKEVEMTDYVRTICLPFDKDYSNINLSGQNFTVSGWGKSSSGDLFGTNEIQFAKVTTWDPVKCNNSLPSEVKPLSTTQICANGAKSEDACKGDSGGPLINVTIDKDLEVKHIQFGIVSFGTGTCGDKNLPAVYTRVDKYLSWITKTVS